MNVLAGVDLNLTELLTDDNFAAVLICCSIGLVVMTGVVARQWRRVRVAEAETALKSQMIAQGYSPEQIEQVVSARSGKARQDPARLA